MADAGEVRNAPLTRLVTDEGWGIISLPSPFFLILNTLGSTVPWKLSREVTLARVVVDSDDCRVGKTAMTAAASRSRSVTRRDRSLFIELSSAFLVLRMTISFTISSRDLASSLVSARRASLSLSRDCSSVVRAPSNLHPWSTT